MYILKRITAIVLAAVMTVSPAFACGGFCADGVGVPAETAGGAHEDCGSATEPAEIHANPGHADCAGSPNCDEMSFKAQTLATAAAVYSPGAPSLVFVSGPATPDLAAPLNAHRHLTPPASGPPLALTPLRFRTLLRI
jgi:hypothetical protein